MSYGIQSIQKILTSVGVWNTLAVDTCLHCFLSFAWALKSVDFEKKSPPPHYWPNHCDSSFSAGSYGSTLRQIRGCILCLPNSAQWVWQPSSLSATSSRPASTYVARSSTTGNGVSAFLFYLQKHLFLIISPLLLE